MEAALLFVAAVGGAAACPPAPPRGMIARSAPFGGVIAPTAADADEAVVAGAVARDAARRFLGLNAPPFLITSDPPEATPSLGGCAFAFPWPFSRHRAGAPHLPTHVLPHEIGHALFIRFLVPKTGIDEYGGGAPDWLDEMAALAFEDPAGVRMRRRDTRRLAERDALIPLARLLSMPHPEWSARRIADSSPTGPVMAPPNSADTPAFYATVRALLDFLIERTGNETVVGLLAEQVRAGAPLDRWLLAHSTRPAEAASLRELDAEITAFVLTDPAYDAARRNLAPGESD